MPTQKTPAANQASRFAWSSVTPPEGISFSQPHGPRTPLMNAGPPRASAGNTLITDAPSRWAWIISVTVPVPGHHGSPCSTQ